VTGGTFTKRALAVQIVHHQRFIYSSRAVLLCGNRRNPIN